MNRYIVVSIGSGILFGVMDAFINGSPLAEKLYVVYKPIARASINMPIATIIDLVFGFALAGIFLLLYRSLPGRSGLTKSLSFAFLVWFLRIVMNTASQRVMFNIPETTLLYMVLAGLFEMIVLSVIYGLFLKPLAQ